MNYYEIDKLSASKLNLLKKSTDHYLTGFKEQTESMKKGSLIHKYLLEPEKFFDSYVISEYDDFRKKEAQQWKSEQTKEVIKYNEFTELKEMESEYLKSPFLNEILKTSHKEFKIEFEYNDLECKSLIDGIDLENNRFFDLKTTTEVWNQFQMESKVKYDYALQMAFYQLACYKEFKRELEPYLIFLSTQRPYQVRIYRVSEHVLVPARQEIENLTNKLKELKLTNFKESEAIYEI